MLLPVLALIGSQLFLVDVVHASPARPGYPFMSFNPTFTSHLISYPTAHFIDSTDLSVTDPTYAYDADNTTKAILVNIKRASTHYYELSSFNTAVLQSPVTKVSIYATFYTQGTAHLPKDQDTLSIAYDPGTGSYVNLVPPTTAAYDLKTYVWKDKSVTSFSSFKIKFEITTVAAVDNIPVDVYEVWVVQTIDPSTAFPTPAAQYDKFINGSRLDVNIRVSEISGTDYPPGLGGYQFQLWYNTTVLTCTGVTYLTNWFPTYTEWYKEINDPLGRLILVVSLSDTPPSPVTGSGDVCTVSFKVDQKGASGLYLNGTELATWEVPAVAFPHEVHHGHYSYPPFDPSTTPMAGFTFSPSSPIMNLPITFDASTTSTSKPSTHTVSGITVTNPTNAYDWNFNTYATFTRNADGYFELSGFSSPTIPAGFSIFRVDCHIKFEADLSWETVDRDLYRVYYLVGATTGTNLVPWTHFDTPLANHTYFDLDEPVDDSWSAADVGNVKLRFETDVQGAAEDLNVNVYEAWLEVQMGGSYARSPWTSPYPYGEGRGWLGNYTWNFDDGNITTVPVPTIVHTYSSAGTYTVNVTVTDRYGLTSFYTYDVTVTTAVPEFPLGAPLYVALAVVIVYVWWRSRQKSNTIRPPGKQSA